MKQILNTRMYNTKVDIGGDNNIIYKNIILAMSPIIEIKGIKNTVCSIYFNRVLFSRMDLDPISIRLYRAGFQKINIFWVTKEKISTNYVEYINDTEENACIIGIYQININNLFDDENFKAKFLTQN